MAGWQSPETVLLGFWIVAAAAPVAGLITAFVMRPTVSQAARVVDLRLGLHQQLGTAEELLVRGSTERLASVQIARASALAGETPIHRAFPLLPRMEAALAAILVVATSMVLVLVSLGVVFPNPLSLIHLPSFSSEAISEAVRDPFGKQREDSDQRSRSPALDSVRQSLESLEQQSLKGALTPGAAAAALAQATSELNRVANESRVHQQALDNLAREMQNTAAGREVAESLRQGDYDRASEQLKELGRQSDKLSEAARQELAQALNRAAAQSRLDEELSRAESDAAQALQRSDYSSTVKSMDELARATQDSANQVVPQQELAENWERLEQLGKQLGNLNPQAGSPPPAAQSSQGASERSSSVPSEGQSPAQADGSELAEGQGEGEGGQQEGGSQPGNARGGPPLGDQSQRLDANGSPLDVEGKIGDRLPGEQSSNPQAPSVMREGKGTNLPSAGGAGAEGPISVPAENVLVPGDRRSIVRDYFNGGSGNR